MVAVAMTTHESAGESAEHHVGGERDFEAGQDLPFEVEGPWARAASTGLQLLQRAFGTGGRGAAAIMSTIGGRVRAPSARARVCRANQARAAPRCNNGTHRPGGGWCHGPGGGARSEAGGTTMGAAQAVARR